MMELKNYQLVVKGMKEGLLVHGFEVWQDPQCDPIVEFVADNLFYYFKCWNVKSPPKSENFLGLFHCKNIESIKYVNPYETYPFLEELDYKCYYYELKNSTWLQEWRRLKLKREPNWSKYNSINYKHFILMTRESYIEIISSGIEFKKVKKTKNKLNLWSKLV
ncbi:hypothetical protein R5N98_11170 [Tenacibaculum maritimum]|uniref:hypothetical protein n=1 Tax=Tenacibaculum maritimum TaxID=107401 RepID=UPI003877098F